MEKKQKTTTIRLTQRDIQAILNIRKAYGLVSDNQAIIFSIRYTESHLPQKGESKG